MKNTKAMNSLFNLSGFFLMLVLVIGCMQGSKEKQDQVSESGLLVPEDKKWSERLALTLMEKYPESYQIDDRDKAKWDYVHGLVLTGFEQLYKSTGNEKYYNYVEGYADILIDSSGTIATYKMADYNIDMIEAGKILFDIYDKTGDQKYKLAMDVLRKQLQDHPRTNSGGFWHKKRYPYQMWLDGLYMGAPFYARYTTEFEEGAALDDIVKQFDLIQQNSYDEATGLLYHGWDESRQMAWANKETGTSPNFWSRSLGWYAMALVDVLDYIPEDHPGHGKIVGYLNELVTALAKYQHESGLWYQVTDMGDREGNYLEASGTSMFVYAIAKGVNKGYLPEETKAIADKGFDGLTRDLVKVDEQGLLRITQACAVAGLGGNPYRDGSFEYYVNERKKDNDPKATGPFILAAIELDR